MCLVDRLSASVPSLKPLLGKGAAPQEAIDELIRLDLLAQTAVFTSQGVPFMLSGEELLRTKQGVHNSFESPDSINQLDWQNKLRYPQVFEYYKNLIQLRKHFPHFRLGSAAEVRDKMCFLNAPSGVVAYSITDTMGNVTNKVIVVLNPTRQQQTVSIPEGHYTIVCASGVIDLNGIDTFTGRQVSVAPQTALIIHD
jgi:pullulanase